MVAACGKNPPLPSVAQTQATYRPIIRPHASLKVGQDTELARAYERSQDDGDKLLLELLMDPETLKTLKFIIVDGAHRWYTNILRLKRISMGTRAFIHTTCIGSCLA
jgi:hypothetical protein